ncbi:MAG: DNA-directed RNA polymerase subunit omega [Candidatus Acidiferrales bacterium]
MASEKNAPVSKFVYVIVAAKRARQLQDGARPLFDSRSRKATRIAQEELGHGLLEYEVPEVPAGEEQGSRRR